MSPFLGAAILGLLVLIAAVVVVFFVSGFVRYIPNNRVGILEKRVSGRGSVKSGFIALHGEAGFQPHVLRGGWHILPPFQYRIHSAPLVTIPQGKIGYVFARDGQPLQPTQTLASNVTANDFQDVAGFLQNGGQRGPQRQILRAPIQWHFTTADARVKLKKLYPTLKPSE